LLPIKNCRSTIAGAKVDTDAGFEWLVRAVVLHGRESLIIKIMAAF
jgi:hypothetical protein